MGTNAAGMSPCAQLLASLVAGSALLVSAGASAAEDRSCHFADLMSNADDSMCAMKSDGRVTCWGYAYASGAGLTTDFNTPHDVLIEGTGAPGIFQVGTLHQLTVGGSFLRWCGVTPAGTAYCWGLNDFGSLGTHDTTWSYTARQVLASPGVPLTGIAKIRGGAGSCAIMTDGRTLCWGINNDGRLGRGTTSASEFAPAPIRVSPSGAPFTGFTQIHIGGGNAVGTGVGLRSDGSVWQWGSMWSDAAGAMVQSTTPVRVERSAGVPLTGIVQAEAFTSSNGLNSVGGCALASTGAIYCWGMDRRLGDNTGTVNSQYAKQVRMSDGTPIAAKDMSVGGAHTCAVLLDGRAVCWGNYSSYGELGNGAIGGATTATAGNVAYAVLVLSNPGVPLVNAARVVSGDRFACVMLNSGIIECWGKNNFGQLGDGTFVSRLYPRQTECASCNSDADCASEPGKPMCSLSGPPMNECIACPGAALSDARIPPIVTPASATGDRSVYVLASVPPEPYRVGRGEIVRASGYKCDAAGNKTAISETRSIAERFGLQAASGDRDLYTVRGGYMPSVVGSVRAGVMTIQPKKYDYGGGVSYTPEKLTSNLWDEYIGDTSGALDERSGRWHAYIATYDKFAGLPSGWRPYATNFLDMHDLDIRAGRKSSTNLTLPVCHARDWKNPATGNTEYVPKLWDPVCAIAIEAFVMGRPTEYASNYGYSFDGSPPPSLPPGMVAPDQNKCDTPFAPSGPDFCWGFHKFRCPSGASGSCDVLGPIIDSTPVTLGPPAEFLPDASYQAYAASMSNYPQMMLVQESGMLHAFDLTPNVAHVEMWSFIPPGAQASLAGTYPGLAYPLLNATPLVRDVPLYIREQDVGYGSNIAALGSRWRRVMLSGLGTYSRLPRAGGASGTAGIRGYYALDLTKPRPSGVPASDYGPKFLWQLTDTPWSKLWSAPRSDHPLSVPNTEYDSSSLTTVAEGQRGTLFGKDNATPAITSLTYKDKSNPNYGHQVAVAILPGGIEAPAFKSGSTLQTCARTNANAGNPKNLIAQSPDSQLTSLFPLRPRKLCWGPSCNGSGTAGCDEAVKGRYVVIARMDTGEIVRVFGRKADFAGGFWGPGSVKAVDKDIVIDTPFDAPMTGTPAVYPQYTGAVATKFFMSDAEGLIWRFDIASNNPSEWHAEIFFDPYAQRATQPGEWRNIDLPIELSLDDAGQLVLAVATGEQTNLSDSASVNVVLSLTETLSRTGGGKPLLNHYHQLEPGRRVVGPMVIEDSKLHYATYRASASAPGCSLASSSLCVRDYVRKRKNADGTDAAPGSGGIVPSMSELSCGSLDSQGCCDMGEPVFSGLAVKPADACSNQPPFDGTALPPSTFSAPNAKTLLWATGSKKADGGPQPQLRSATIAPAAISRRSVLDSWVAILE